MALLVPSTTMSPESTKKYNLLSEKAAFFNQFRHIITSEKMSTAKKAGLATSTLATYLLMKKHTGPVDNKWKGVKVSEVLWYNF